MQPTAAFISGLILGGAIWLLSPLVTGRVEPWDAGGWYFVGALIASGLLIGLAIRRWVWLAVLGIYVGQAMVMFLRPQGGGERAPWWATAYMLAIFTAISLGASLLVVVTRWLLLRRSSRRRTGDNQSVVPTRPEC